VHARVRSSFTVVYGTLYAQCIKSGGQLGVKPKLHGGHGPMPPVKTPLIAERSVQSV